LYIQPHSPAAIWLAAFASITTMVSTLNTDQKTDQKPAPEPAPSVRHQAKAQATEIAQQMSQECVARRLRQVNRTVTRLYDEALRPHGITVNQLNILAVIISEQQIRPGQLGQALGMEKSTVSRTIDRMVSKNWLKVSQGQDSRTQILTVTSKGRQLLLVVTPIWDALQSGILATGGNNILNMLAVTEAATEPANEAAGTTEAYVPLTKYEPPYQHEPVSADDFYL
jgi:DNA-binding MarR family transcriptional regulator